MDRDSASGEKTYRVSTSHLNVSNSDITNFFRIQSQSVYTRFQHFLKQNVRCRILEHTSSCLTDRRSQRSVSSSFFLDVSIRDLERGRGWNCKDVRYDNDIIGSFTSQTTPRTISYVSLSQMSRNARYAFVFHSFRFLFFLSSRIQFQVTIKIEKCISNVICV